MPCSPGMRSCMKNNPGCQHLKFVLEHRADMSVWEVQRDEGGLGYKEETADWEQSNPAPRLQDKMIHRERPPEGDVVVVQGNRLAEEVVLSVAMSNRKAVALVTQLDPEEFRDPLNRRIAETIVNLEDQGLRADSVAVENDLRQQPDVPQDPRWDSSMPMGDVDRTDHGLQRWEKMGPVYDNAVWAAQEVRSQSQAQQTEDAAKWTLSRINGQETIGITPEGTKKVQDDMRGMLDRIRPDLPAESPGRRSSQWEASRPPQRQVFPPKQPEKFALTPAHHQHSKPQARHSRART